MTAGTVVVAAGMVVATAGMAAVVAGMAAMAGMVAAALAAWCGSMIGRKYLAKTIEQKNKA